MRKGYCWFLQTSWRQNSLFLQLCMWVMSQCSYKPPTGQMLFSVLQLLISIWMEKCFTLKGESLQNGLPIHFRLRQHSKSWNTKGKVKESEPIWSQICSSLLNWVKSFINYITMCQEIDSCLSNLLLLTTQLARWCSLHFTDEETEAQSGWMPCSSPCSWKSDETWFMWLQSLFSKEFLF